MKKYNLSLIIIILFAILYMSQAFAEEEVGQAKAIERRVIISAKEMIKTLDALYEAWKIKTEKTCRLPVEPSARIEKSRPASKMRTIKLRQQPLKADPKGAKEIFSIDSLWRPLNFIQNEFVTNNTDTVTDTATGLLWQKAGTDYPINWNQAHLYIEKLNDTLFAGRSNWRLPTVDELMSILTETPHGEDFCIESVFDQSQKWLWSSDRRSYIAAWYVSFDMGFVAWQDFSGYCHVKAVSEE